MTDSGTWPAWLTPAVATATFVGLTALETLRPLRAPTQPKLPRMVRNLATAALAAAPTALQGMALGALMPWLEERRLGALFLVPLPGWLHLALGVVLLDATLWLWHWATHAVPLLWRFHLVHHVDLDMDASTALRFHFGEMAFSVGYRTLQVVLLGVPAMALALWHGLLLVSILFHHSNLRLPLALERVLVLVVVTPRMHGIHHSTVRAERNTNFSSLLSVWDRLFGTLLLAIPQQQVRVGVPPLLAETDTTLGRITLLPFGPRARSGLAG